MTNKRIILEFIIAALLLAASAYADCSYNLAVVNGIDFGTQTSNSSIIDNIFTINNTGNCSLSDVTIITDAASKYNVLFNGSSALNTGNMSIGAAKTLRVSAFIPRDEPDGNRSIGSVTVLSAERNFISLLNMPVYVQGKLLILSVDVKVEGEEDSNIDDNPDGYEIDKKATLGDTIEFSIKVKNDYDSDSDVSINNIGINVDIDNMDIDEDAEDFDLSEQDTVTKDITFVIPDDADMNDYDVEITINGKDDDNIKYELKRTFILRVEKKSTDLRITAFNLTKNMVECNRKISIIAEVTNYGDGKERDVVFTIKNSDLGININEIAGDLDDNLDEDDSSFRKVYNLDIKDDAQARVYMLQMDAYKNTDDWEARKALYLEVKNCIKEEPEEAAAIIEELYTDNDTVPVLSVQPQAIDAELLQPTDTAAVKPISTTEEASVLEYLGNNTWAIFLMLNVIVISVILLALAYIAGKKKPVKE